MWTLSAKEVGALATDKEVTVLGKVLALLLSKLYDMTSGSHYPSSPARSAAVTLELIFFGVYSVSWSELINCFIVFSFPISGKSQNPIVARQQ